jgi:hypothetical protein
VVEWALIVRHIETTMIPIHTILVINGFDTDEKNARPTQPTALILNGT